MRVMPGSLRWTTAVVALCICAVVCGTSAQGSAPGSSLTSPPSGDPGAASSLDTLIRDKVAAGKKRLAQSFVEKELRNRAAANVSPSFTWKLGSMAGTSASSFRSFNQSFILSGRDLYRLEAAAEPIGFSTEKVAKFQEFLGDVIFVESVEWDGLLLLLAAYEQRFLQLFTLDPDHRVVLQQTIAGYGVPIDAEFFTQDGQLFLVVAQRNTSDFTPIVVYRWTGTHLDEENKRLLVEPVAIATFPFQEYTIIVVAVGAASGQRAGLVVLRRSYSRIEMIQFLPTSQPVAMQHFLFRSENYLFVTNTVGSSVICWWSGSDLTVWDTLSGVEGVRSIGVGYIRGDTLILLADQTRVRVYRPTASSLEYLDTFEFSATVLSATVYVPDVQSDTVEVVIITESSGVLVPLIMELRFTVQPNSASHLAEDPLLQCMSLLDAELKTRRSTLNDLKAEGASLLRIDQPGTFPGKLIVQKVVLNNANVNSVGLSPAGGKSLAMSPRQLQEEMSHTLNQVKVLMGDMNHIVFKSKPAAWSGRLVTDQLEVETASMDAAHIAKINGVAFDPKNLLSYTKNQKLTGSITADMLEVDSLHVDSLAGHRIEDILKRRGDQTLEALEALPQLSAAGISVGGEKTINGIPLERVVHTKMAPNIPITGTKTFNGLDLQDLSVNLFNNRNFTEWVQSLVPPVRPAVGQVPLTQTRGSSKNLFFGGDLVIRNLTVKTINDFSIDELVASLFLKGLNQRIMGDLTYVNQVTATDLTANSINGVPVQKLLTRTTDQVVSGDLVVESFSAMDVVTNSVNGLKISQEAAYIDSGFPVTGPVVFQKLQVREIGLPPHATINGRSMSPRLHTPPLFIYEGTVRIGGSLHLKDLQFDTTQIKLRGDLVSIQDLPMLYWTKSSQQVINVPVSAPFGMAVESLQAAMINGMRPESLVRVDTERLRGSWSFAAAHIQGDLVHAPSAYQMPVNPTVLAKSVARTSGDYVISGRKTFLGGLTVESLDAQYLDQVKVSDLLVEGRTGGSRRSLQELWVEGDLIIRSNLKVDYVSGIPLCKRLEKAILIDREGFVQGATMAAVSASNIDVTTFNGRPMSVIGGGLGGVERTPHVPRVSKLTIRGDLIVPELQNVMGINSKPVNEYLSRVVDRRQMTPIHGKKTFSGRLDVQGDFNALHFDGLDIEEFAVNMLSRTRRQIIPVHARFAELTTGSFNARVVNGIEISNLLTSDQMSRQIIVGDIRFRNDVDVMGTLSYNSFQEDCDINLVAAKLNSLDGRKWTSLTVEGDLTWAEPLPDRKLGLGYYMRSAVTRDSEQLIVGEVVFNATVSTGNLYSRMDINDIDIAGIQRDALRKSAPHQVINGQKVLIKKLTTTNMRVEGNVEAKTVAGVDILTLNRSLVRVDGDREVRGHKRFLQGFSAKMLKVDGTVNGMPTSDVAMYDMPNLPTIQFNAPFTVKNDLTFTNVNGLSMAELLKERVTLDGEQHIQGRITFERDLSVEGNLVTPSINQIDISDVVAGESDAEQVIEGRKHFMESLRVEGPMEIGTLDDMSFTVAHSATIFKDEDVNIAGDVVFGTKVAVNADVYVDRTVNGVEMAELARKLSSVTQRSLAQVRSIARTINETNALLKARGDLSEFLYLEPVLGLPIAVHQTRKAVAHDLGDGEVRVDVYGWTASPGETALGGCGLPVHCTCPTHHTMQVGPDGLSKATWLSTNSSQRAFTFRLDDRSGFTVKVLTNTVSTSPRCRLTHNQVNEFTTITWMTPVQSPTAPELVADVTIDPYPVLGYLSDAKLIAVSNRTYVVLALAYSAELDSTNMNSVLLRLDTGANKARIVGEFPTQGVASLDVFYTEKGAHLVVGNSYDSERRSSQVHVDIYRFNVYTDQLVLLRRVPADGVVGVASVVQGEESLVVVAQEQPYAPVLVLKYNPEHDDYHFNQQLLHDTTPTGLGVFYVGEFGESDAFLGVSTADNIFHLYKYSHIEGFKLVLKEDLRGVQGFTSFSVGQSQYLFFTSDEPNSLVQVVKQIS